MIKYINFAAAAAICAMASVATADGNSPQPAYVNDMPFPAEMPTYTPRVIFDDLPFHDHVSGQQVVVFGDVPFPSQMKAYVPIRNYADMPTRADILANNSDQAMLQIAD